MANITVVGKAVVVTSTLSMEDLELIRKYRPEALVLKGGEDGKEPVFAIGFGIGSINSVGVSFDGETRDDAKLATLTMSTDYEGDNVAEYVADKIGGGVASLEKLEASLPAVVAEIKAEKEAILSRINVVQ